MSKKKPLMKFSATVIVPAEEYIAARDEATRRRQAAADRWNKAHPNITPEENAAAIQELFASFQASQKQQGKTHPA